MLLVVISMPTSGRGRWSRIGPADFPTIFLYIYRAVNQIPLSANANTHHPDPDVKRPDDKIIKHVELRAIIQRAIFKQFLFAIHLSAERYLSVAIHGGAEACRNEREHNRSISLIRATCLFTKAEIQLAKRSRGPLKRK